MIPDQIDGYPVTTIATVDGEDARIIAWYLANYAEELLAFAVEEADIQVMEPAVVGVPAYPL